MPAWLWRKWKTFEVLAPYLSAEFTCICPDLPFHGSTIWNGPLKLELAELLSIIQTMAHSARTTCYLLGYSLGGRIALSLAQHFATSVNGIVLLCPDGLRVPPFQWLATRTLIGNHLFRRLMNHPGMVTKAVHLLEKAGLVNASVSRFSLQYINDGASCDLLYKRWTIFRKFRPDILLIKSLLIKYRITLRAVFGRYDRIISSRHAAVLENNNGGFVHIHILDAGHQLLKDKYAQPIASLFYEQ